MKYYFKLLIIKYYLGWGGGNENYQAFLLAQNLIVQQDFKLDIKFFTIKNIFIAFLLEYIIIA